MHPLLEDALFSPRRPRLGKGRLWDLANAAALRYYRDLRPQASQEERYRGLMKVRVLLNPELAIGQEEGKAPIAVGRSQFDYLRENGLRPQHYLLDYGCGAIRGGRHFIPYLEPGHYFGVDISPDVLRYAGWYARRHGLAEREPTLRALSASGIPFERAFDFMIAQSVFSHTDEATTIRILRQMVLRLAPGGRIFGTFWIREQPGEWMGIDYYYRPDQVHGLAAAAGLVAEIRDDYQHPSQQMVVFRQA